MKSFTVTSLAGLLALATAASAQTATTATTSGFAPANFGNMILTSTPSNATGASGISNVYTSAGTGFTFGTGGALVNPTQYDYVVTGPNTATITYPASGGNAATTTQLVFTNANGGTYTTTSGSTTSTGSFRLAEIPSSAPISNVSARTTLATGGSSIVGFVIAGTVPRRVLIRAVGPGLAPFGVSTFLQNPKLSLYSGRTLLAQNTAWGTMQSLTTTASVGPAAGSSAGTGAGGTSSGSTSSGSTSTGTGSTVSISTGSTSGGTPTVTGTTANGVFTGTLANGSSFTTQLATTADFSEVGAFGLTIGSNDAAIVATLPPGAYTIVVSAGASLAVSGGTAGRTSGGTVTITTGTTTSGSTTGTTSGSTTGMTSGTTTGTTSGGTTSGTSTSTTSSTTKGTSAGTTSTGTTSSGTTTTTGTTSTGTTSTGTTSGGTTSGTGSTSGVGSSTGSGSTSGTGMTASATSGDVLVEVYFLQ